MNILYNNKWMLTFNKNIGNTYDLNRFMIHTGDVPKYKFRIANVYLLYVDINTSSIWILFVQ